MNIFSPVKACIHNSILTGLIAAIVTPVFAAEEHPYYTTPKFSDPAELVSVTPAWLNKPLSYEKYDADADLVVGLGQQSYPMFKELIEEYAQKNRLKIVVKQGTCGITSGRLRKKTIDIGSYCCPPAKTDRLPGLKFHSLGVSPIALIVHPDNPLTNITTEQARKIFQGIPARWNQLKTAETRNYDRLIKPVARLHCKIRPGHWRGLLNSEDQFSPRLFEVGVIPDMISQIARNTGAIGWEVPLMVSYHKERGKVKMLKINGLSATDSQQLLSGKYPLYRSYSLTTWQDKAGSKKNQQALKLVKFLQQYVEKTHKDVHFIPPSRLVKAGWKFKNGELVGTP